MIDYKYYTKSEYDDNYITEFVKDVHGITVEQEFYRHGAYFIKSFLYGKEIDPRLVEWYERLREIGSIRFSIWKQIRWLFKVKIYG